jgi:hypothetical protein
MATVRIADTDRLDELGAAPGVGCWVPDAETREYGPYARGEIVAKEGDTYKIKLMSGKTVSKPLNDMLGANETNPSEVLDLTRVMYIHPAAISEILKIRYQRAQIYTYVGAMLLVVNPFKDLKLTTNEKIIAYRKMDKDIIMESKGEPHVFALCAKSLHEFNIPGSDINLSFVISGESGAGKTETTKHILSFFTCPADGSDLKDPISTAIMAGNPILEAFGNATTQRNNNSSRFGRLIRLFCEIDMVEGVPAPRLLGGDVSPFLLEKSRITHPAEKERNYHIFYQLCKSVTPEELAGYDLPADWHSLNYIKRTKLFDVPNAKENHDQNEFKEVEESFVNIKCTATQIASIKKLVAAVLLLGQIEVKQVGETEEVEPADWTTVEKAEKQLEVEREACGVGLFICCAKKFRVIDGKETPCPLKVPDAQNSVHCIGRSIFQKLFDWQIDKINDAVKVANPDDSRWAAVLDIFGFEIMAVNSLEQLLINYANERLQQFFIANVFAKERVIYSDEGIDPSCVTFEDNSAFIMVVDNDKAKEGPVGIMAQLNSSCKNGSGTDQTFLNDVKNAKYPSEHFEPGGGSKATEVFYLHHSMARVEYAVANWREKNMEALQQKAVNVMLSSKDALLAEMFQEKEGEKSGGYTCDQFKASINSLLTILQNSKPFFLRCLKPNQTKIPGDYDYKCTVAQLNSLSILDALSLAQKGYPSRDTYEDFMHSSARVLSYVINPQGDSAKEKALDLLKRVGNITVPDYQEGTTKLFLKKLTQRFLDNKSNAVLRSGEKIAEDLIRLASVQRVTTSYHQALDRAITVQAFARGWRERLVIQKLQKRKRAFWGTCLWTFRTMRFKRDRLAAYTLQCTLRELRSMRTAHELVKEQMTASAKQNLWCYVQAVKAQRKLEECIKARLKEKQMQVVRKVGRSWMQKEGLRRYWAWRSMSQPVRRVVAYRIRCVCKVQGIIRGMLARNSEKGQEVAAKILIVRRSMELEKACYIVQRGAKATLLLTRFTKMFSAAGLVQYYVQAKFERRLFVRMRKAAVRIQNAFRGWIVRTFLAWQKLMVLYRMELASMDRITRNQRKKIHELLGARPMSLIMLTSCIDIRAFYKEGWMRGYEDIIRRDGIQKMAVGAEHTVVVAQSGIYAWGSDEVGQLGRGDPKATETEKSFGLVSPILKNRVSDVSCGRWHTIAILEGPQPLWCWGLNHRGQCGLKSYIKGAAFTPSYPKLVRTPTALTVDSVVTHIAAGPFHSAALVGTPTKTYLWGEGDACGQIRDVRLPMKITDDQVSSLALGDGFCMLVQDDNIKVVGRNCVQLGLAGPAQMEKHEGYLRFDNSAFLGRGKIYPMPIPCKLPRATISQVCVGEQHVMCLNGNGEVYEWGIRAVIKATSKPKDLGLMAIWTPVKLELGGIDRVDEIRAGGDTSVAITQKNVAYGWQFLEDPERGIKPAFWQFRHLRNTATRLEMCSSPSLVCVLGFSDNWKELDINEVEWERQRPRGASQPLTPEFSALQANKRPQMRTSMGKPISSVNDVLATPRPDGPATPRVAATPRSQGLVTPRYAPASRTRTGSPGRGGLSPPSTPAALGKATPEKTSRPGTGAATVGGMPGVRSREAPLFPSPTFATGGADVPNLRTPARASFHPGKPLGRGTPKKAGPERAARPGDLTGGDAGAPDACDERTRMLYEIQASLKDRPLTELSSISRQLRK